MPERRRVVVVLPAYNAERTLERTCAEIPRDVVDEILLVDDASHDRTVEVAKLLGIPTIVHPKNRGYGGNQKTCYQGALDRGADIVVMLHPDYQYPPRIIPAMVALVNSGMFDVVIGSRVLVRGALQGGMPIYKYVSNRLLTLAENLILGRKLSEYHTGFRAFNRRVLETLPLLENSDGFVFDNEMLCQAIYFGFSIGEVSSPCKYFPEASSIGFLSSVRYGLGVLRTALLYRLNRWGMVRSPASLRRGGGWSKRGAPLPPDRPSSDDTIPPPMTESGAPDSQTPPAPATRARGGLVLPTLVFALYLGHAAAAMILAVAGYRVYCLTAGFTTLAGCAALAAVALSGAIGAAWAGARCRHATRPMALLFLAQAAFGLAAVLSIGTFRASRSLYLLLWPSLGQNPASGPLLRLLLAVGVFALPAAVACIPAVVLARLIALREEGMGLGLGFSFGLTIAGSALGLAAAGGFILPRLGIRGTVLMGLALAGVSAAGSLLLRQLGLEGPGAVGALLGGGVAAADTEPPGERSTITTTGEAGALGAAIILTAFTGWGLLIVWDRALSFLVGRTLMARVVSGSIFLLGMALGAFLCSALADRVKSTFAALAAVLTAASIAAYASMFLMQRVALLYLNLTPLLDMRGLSALPGVLATAALMLPAVLFLGATLPLFAQGTRLRMRPAPGVVIFFALGVVLADVSIGILAIPAFGLRRSLGLLAAVGLFPAILCVSFARFKNPTVRPTVVLVLLGLMIVLGGFPASWDPRTIDAGLYRYGARSLSRFGSVEQFLQARRTIDVPFYREGREASVMVERSLQGGKGETPTETLSLTVDGKVEAATGNDIATQVLQGHIPILLHGPTESVLQIDFLNGVTAGSVLRHPVKRLTVLEREPSLFDASPTFASYNNSPTEDKRLLRVVDGARARLLADATRYDVIIVAGFEPWLPSSAPLATTGGLALLKERLNTGGILALRVPLASAGDHEVRTVLRDFARAFPSVLVFQISGEDLLLIGSLDPLALDIGWFRNVLSSSGEVSRDLRRITVFGPNEILYAFRIAKDDLLKTLGEGEGNDDDRAPVEFVSARQMAVHNNAELLGAIEDAKASVLPLLRNYGATPEEKGLFLYNLAKSYLGIAGDPARARDLARELQALNQPIRALWVMGETLMQQSDLDGALGQWRGVLDLDPGNLDALFSLGTYYMDSRDYWKAAPYLETAARRHPDVSVVRYNHGRNLYYLGKDREAIAELREARRLSLEQLKKDDYPLVDYLVGVAQHRMKSDKEAAESLETYLKWAYTQPLTRVEVDAHLKLAEAYDSIGKRFEAHKQRQKGEDLLRRIQAQPGQSAVPAAAPPGPVPPAAPPHH